MKRVRFDYEGTQHEAELVDDGTMDTLIKVDGVVHRFDGAYTGKFRDQTSGEMNALAVQELAIECLDHMRKD